MNKLTPPLLAATLATPGLAQAHGETRDKNATIAVKKEPKAWGAAGSARGARSAWPPDRNERN